MAAQRGQSVLGVSAFRIWWRRWPAPKQVTGQRHSPRISAYGVLRVFLGLVLLTAAALKAHQLATEPVLGTGILDSRWFLIGLVEFELLLGLWLLSGLYPQASRRAAIGCFATFAGVSLWKALSGETSCGCFGSTVTVHPWYPFGLDVTALAALLAFRPRCRVRIVSAGGWSRCQVVYLLSVAVTLAFPIGLGSFSPKVSALDEAGRVVGDGTVVALEPEKWVGKPFPLLDCIDVGTQLICDDWLVVLYRPDCSECEALLSGSEYLDAAHIFGVPAGRLALVEVSSNKGAGRDAAREPLRALHGSLARGYDWYVSTPLVVQLRNGIVQNVAEPAARRPDGGGGRKSVGAHSTGAGK